MKNLTSISLLLTACFGLLFAQGCTKQEATTAPAGSSSDAVSTTPAASTHLPPSPPLTDVQAAATNAAAEVQATANQAAADAQKAADNAAASTQAQITALFEKIKGLIAEKKYAEAALSLNEVSQMKLTTDQQSWVEQMKAQVQKAIASQNLPEAAKTLDGFLNKK